MKSRTNQVLSATFVWTQPKMPSSPCVDIFSGMWRNRICSFLFDHFFSSWPCLHQWLETKPQQQVCPVCKAAISRQKVIPLYGRGFSQQDPRDKLPPRPQGQRTEPEPASSNVCSICLLTIWFELIMHINYNTDYFDSFPHLDLGLETVGFTWHSVLALFLLAFLLPLLISEITDQLLVSSWPFNQN